MSTKQNNNGFELLTGKITPRLTICSAGASKHGKTHFAMSAPDPIFVFALDPNTREVCEKAVRETGKKIYLREFIKGPLALMDDINSHKRHWKLLRDAYYKAAEQKDIRTIVIDSGSQLWEDGRYAHVGRRRIDTSSEVNAKGEVITDDKTGQGFKVGIDQVRARDLGPVKQDIRDMINACGEWQNMIITHRTKPEWANDRPTGKNVREGMPGIEFLASLELFHEKEENGQFKATLVSSTMNGDIRGRKPADELTGDDINFVMAALLCFPDSAEEDWG